MFYDKCEKCGGDLEQCSGVVIDTLPSIYPVKCSNCNNPQNSSSLEECKAANWSKPDHVSLSLWNSL